MNGKENYILLLLIFFKAEKNHEGNIRQDTVITKSLMFGKSFKKALQTAFHVKSIKGRCHMTNVGYTKIRFEILIV